MKQEEVNKIVNEVIRDEINLGQYARNEIPIEEFIRISFQKGKIEQKKEDIKIINNFFNPMIVELKEVKGTENITDDEIDLMIKWRERLSEEIGGMK